MPIPKPNNKRRMTLGVVNTNVENDLSTAIDVTGAVADDKPSRSSKARIRSMIPRLNGGAGADAENIPPPKALPVARSTSRSRSRSSMGVAKSRASGIGGEASRRVSGVGTGGDRRNGSRRQSSIPPPALSAKSEPRPIMDKTYQMECIHKLLDFLTQSGYEYPISLKSLSRPSGKDFSNIMTFMLRLVDPSFQVGTMKFEDEVVMNFKHLGYPFPVSKTALVTAGSHSWPSLLAALVWLVDHLHVLLIDLPNVEIDEETEYSSIDEIERVAPKVFRRYVDLGYQAYLDNDTIGQEKLEHAIIERFERDDCILADAVREVKMDGKAILDSTERIKLRWNTFDDSKTRQREYEQTVSEMEDLLRQLAEEGKRSTARKQELVDKLAGHSRKRVKLEESIKRLEDTIKNQALSVDDFNKLQFNLKITIEGIDRATRLRDELLGDNRAAESSFREAWDAMESVILRYDALLSELTSLPLVSSKKVNMTIKADKSAADGGSLGAILSADLVAIQQCLADCRVDFGRETAQYKSDNQNFLDSLARAEQDLVAAEENLKALQGKYAKLDEQSVSERATQDAKLDVRLREIAVVERQIASIRDPSVSLEERKAELGHRCSELESRRCQLVADHFITRKEMCAEIDKAITLYCEHEAYAQEMIAQAKEYKRKKKASHGKLNMPAVP